MTSNVYSTGEWESEKREVRRAKYKERNSRYADQNYLREGATHEVQSYRFCRFCLLDSKCLKEHEPFNSCEDGIWDVKCPGCGRKYSTRQRRCSHCGSKLALETEA